MLLRCLRARGHAAAVVRPAAHAMMQKTRRRRRLVLLILNHLLVLLVLLLLSLKRRRLWELTACVSKSPIPIILARRCHVRNEMIVFKTRFSVIQ